MFTRGLKKFARLVRAGGIFEDGKPDFLVNDVPDLHDDPDTLWLSDSTTQRVETVTGGNVTGSLSPGNLSVQLSAALPGGWAYLRVPDPGNGQYRLVGILRSDSAAVTVNTNAWVTDRTFQGLGKPPVRENTLHILDYNSTGAYTLIYEPLPQTDLEAPSSALAALPAESRPNIPVNWSGQDNAGGRGLGRFDIYTSENSGPFQRWLTGTEETAAVYSGSSTPSGPRKRLLQRLNWG